MSTTVDQQHASGTGAGPTDAPTGSWLLPATALGTLVLGEVLRVWQPSVAFIYGRAGSTPATQMGLFALLWFLAAFVLAPFVARLGARRVVLGGAAVLLAARVVLQSSSGGDVQLWTASIGLLAGLVWLLGLAAGSPSRREVGLGIVAGIAGLAALRGALRSVGLVWEHGVLAWVAVLIVLAAFAAATMRSALLAGWAGDADAEQDGADHGPAWPWLAIGPALVLAGVLSMVPSRTELATGLPLWAAVAIVVAANAAGFLLARRPVGRSGAVAAAVLVVGGTPLALGATSWANVVGQVLLAAGLGLAVGAVTRTPGTSTPTRRALAMAGGMFVYAVVVFLYYSAYDFNLGVDNGAVLVAAGVLVGLLALLARPAGEDGVRRSPLARAATSSVLGGAALLVAASAATAAIATPAVTTTSGNGFPIRVMTYNLHMGWDTVGRYDPGALADVIAAQHPDIVVLNEVDRGWLLNGAHDLLPIVAGRLGMTYRFAPAADDVWGNAILSKVPVSQVGTEPLPRGGVPMARSVLWLVADIGDGQQLGVVATHLHHVEGEGAVRLPQAEEVARVAGTLTDGNRPVVVMGDMNAEPGAPELAPLESSLNDLLAPFEPLATFPSWGPTQHIDHVFGTAGLSASDLVIPDSQASDHRGVAVTLQRNS